MATVTPTIAVIIAAAGNSSRMGKGIDKQFAPVGGKPLLWHSLRRFSAMPEVRQILVTVSPTNEERVAALIQDTVGDVSWQVVPGGAGRGIVIRQNGISLSPIADGPDSATVTMSHAIPVEIGALFSAGPLGGEVERMIVFAIEPHADLTATITCVDEAPGLWA